MKIQYHYSTATVVLSNAILILFVATFPGLMDA